VRFKAFGFLPLTFLFAFAQLPLMQRYNEARRRSAPNRGNAPSTSVNPKGSEGSAFALLMGGGTPIPISAATPGIVGLREAAGNLVQSDVC
jgi:hypothetical protein